MCSRRGVQVEQAGTRGITGSICRGVGGTGEHIAGLSTALLLIDELGFDPMTRQEASLFFRLVSYRYGRGAIMITTNKSVRDWAELLAGDEVLTTAILDRLLHRSHVLNIKGRSYRLRDLEEESWMAPSTVPCWRGREGASCYGKWGRLRSAIASDS